MQLKYKLMFSVLGNEHSNALLTTKKIFVNIYLQKIKIKVRF